MEISPDETFGMRYANMVSILNTIEKYLEKSPENNRFIMSKVNVKKQININDLLKNEQSQLINLCEFLLFILTISPKVDQYLDKLEYADDKLVNAFCSISDKFLIHKDDQLNSSISSMQFQHRMSTEDLRGSSVSLNKQHQDQYSKLQKKFDELSKEKAMHSKNFNDLEKQYTSIREKYNSLDKNYTELDIKYKDCLREIESLKNTNKSNFRVQEELLQDSIQINSYKNQIRQIEMEMDELKKDQDSQIKSYQDKISLLNEKIENYVDKISSMESISSENEKLKRKLKESSILKEKLASFDELNSNLESMSRMVDNLMKEKQVYITQIEKCNKDISAEREKFRLSDSERKRLEFEFNDLRKENQRIENRMKNRESQFLNFNALSDIRRNSINYENREDRGNYLFELEQSTVIYEIEKTKDERIQILEKEIEELSQEKNELIKKYNFQNEDINKKLEDKEKLFTDIEQTKLELKKMTNEKDKLLLEKEKLLLKIQKIELDLKRVEISAESEKKKIEDENKEYCDKIKKVFLEKDNLLKEIEILKNTENKENINAISDIEKLKPLYEKEINSLKQKLKTTNNSTQNSKEDLNEFKTEIQILKQTIINKDESIKALQSKVKNLENDSQNLNITMQDSVEKFNQDIIKRSEDLEFYKRSYEEQKKRVNTEHELISSSLYELALQFMSLKGELQKKVNSGVSNKNWLENERNKNFPLDNK